MQRGLKFNWTKWIEDLITDQEKSREVIQGMNNQTNLIEIPLTSEEERRRSADDALGLMVVEGKL